MRYPTSSNSKELTHWSKAGLVAFVVGLIATGCSLLHDLSPDQCELNSDCIDTFGQGYTCNAGLCKAGGQSANEPSSSAEPAADAGITCTQHKDCLDEFGDIEPQVCVEAQCVPLLTDECPFALPMRNEQWLESLSSSDAVILGGYSPIPAQSRISHFTRFYDLALDEFTHEVGGLPGNNGRKQIVMVVCEGESPDRESLSASAQHLTETLKVPGIASTLQSDDLQFVFETYGKKEETFILSGLDADEAILNLKDDGLVWTMLTGAEELTKPLPALLDRTIEHLSETTLAETEEAIRVALVAPTAAPRLLAEIGGHATSGLRFNGLSATENYPASFQVIDIVTTYEDTEASLLQDGVVEALLDFRPHIIVAMAAEEFLTSVIPLFEDRWFEEVGEAQPAPFYVLSPYHIYASGLDRILAGTPDFAQRAVGLAYASAPDSTNYKQYLLRLDQAFPDIQADSSRLGKENFYDLPYFLLYAAAAAGSPPKLTGPLLAQGMSRLVDGPQYNVGRKDMRVAMNLLQADSRSTILLDGTLGPAHFDLGTGARADSGSVFCVDESADFIADILRWDENAQAFTEAEPAIGEACIPGF